MTDKPKYFISVGKGSAWFVDSDGNHIPVESASLHVIPPAPEAEPVMVERTSMPSATWTFKSMSRQTFDHLLRIIDPREWWRRHWWKLPALWKR